MAGFSSSYGSSYSDPSLMESPESQWGMQLSQLLSSLGQNQYKWAMDQFNNGMGVTNQNISQYLDLAGKGAGLAQNLLSRYKDTFEPLMDSYIRQAGTYNSEARQKFMMGQAESTVGQADEAARSEAERKLQGFGINPNSGRYQDLMLTGRIQDAAARAGAGTQASLNTAAIGRQMTQQAAQMGQNVPGMTVNALQSAYTGVTGAENALLGMLNTGANMTSSAAPFMNAASGAIKMPPVGNKAKSQQRSQNTQMDAGHGQGDKSGQGQGQGPGRGAQNYNDSDRGKAWMPEHGNGSVTSRFPPPGKTKPGAQDDPTQGWDQYQNEVDDTLNKAGNNPDWNGPNMANEYKDKGTGESVNPQAPSGMDPWDPQTYAGAGGSPWWADSKNPDMASGPIVPGFDGNWDGGTTQTGQTDQNMPPAPQQWNANQPMGPQQSPQTSQADDDLTTGSLGNQGGDNPFNGMQQTELQSGSDYTGWQPQQDQGQAGGGNWWDQYDQPSQDQGQQDQSQGYAQQDQGQQDFGSDQGSGQGSNYGGYDPQAQGGDYSGYARGGPVRPKNAGVLPTTGGGVPRSASPSQGRQTDDIPARLNAGEFVVPRDVVAHKGTEFFKKLIEGSRKLRTGMGGPPAKPTMKPGLRLNPTFVSRGM